MTNALFDCASVSSAWPFQEARDLWEKRLKKAIPQKGYVLFETGYGPSGLPHIGTFGEVARTTWVRQAFQLLNPDVPTKLFAFSDDMDALRKVPDNVPKQDMLAAYLGKPLTQIPDPFGTHESFGHHNNARLCQFLDRFGFAYELKSATSLYKSGVFDQALRSVLEHYEEIMAVMLPTLGGERQSTYSPFMPICPRTGLVLQVPTLSRDIQAGTIVYQDPDTGQKVEVPVTGGACKLQWKPDWGMRWHALGVDYEMSGKDLIPSVALAGKVCRLLGSTPPQNLSYELFLDEEGQKISKSKGNGLSIDEWLRYGPKESLALFMYQKPKTAKRLYFDIIPRAVDEYITHCMSFGGQEPKNQLSNPVWHLHEGSPPQRKAPLSFSILLNLVGVTHTDDPKVIWHYIRGYAPEATPEAEPFLDHLVMHAIAYYNDFVKPTKRYRHAAQADIIALTDLRDTLQHLPGGSSGEELQQIVYDVGKRHAETYPGLKDWFKAQYEILLGQEQGPRMGSFFALYGVDRSIALLDCVISGKTPDA